MEKFHVFVKYINEKTFFFLDKNNPTSFLIQINMLIQD